MIRDLAVGEDRRKEFTSHLSKLKMELPVEFNLELLSSGFWFATRLISLLIFNKCVYFLLFLLVAPLGFGTHTHTHKKKNSSICTTLH
jgi:hypothetical protein